MSADTHTHTKAGREKRKSQWKSGGKGREKEAVQAVCLRMWSDLCFLCPFFPERYIHGSWL